MPSSAGGGRAFALLEMEERTFQAGWKSIAPDTISLIREVSRSQSVASRCYHTVALAVLQVDVNWVA
jgi:hypothetical protein